MRINRLILGMVAVCLVRVSLAQDAPYVDSKITRDRFKEVTDDDLAELRTKKILFASRSFGLNLGNGIRILAKQDKKYDLLGEWKRYDVFKAGGDVSVIPADAFAKSNFVHFMATYWPHTKRMEEMDQVLRQPPHEFAKQADIVIVFFHTALPQNFEQYCGYMDKWRADFPKIKFIYVTAGFMGPKYAKENENAHAWSEKVRERYQGKQPLYDLGKILSDDFRAGHVYAPEYSKDPAEVHPNTDEGQTMMAKGMLLLLRDTLKWQGGGKDLAPVPAKGAKEVAKAETLPPNHPEMVSVQSILDENNLKSKKAASVAVVENGHVTKLYLQEGGVTTLTDAIGGLPELRVLHVYGDRNLKLPLLKTISPAIGECTKLEELLLNSNELTTLPASITQLTKLQKLSLADNHLTDLPADVKAWAEKFDTKGLGDQKR